MPGNLKKISHFFCVVMKIIPVAPNQISRHEKTGGKSVGFSLFSGSDVCVVVFSGLCTSVSPVIIQTIANQMPMKHVMAQFMRQSETLPRFWI